MTVDLNIINGKIFTKGELKDGGISIEGEFIVKVGKEPSLLKASETIDAKGALVLPGLIDIHVHLRDLEQSYKETMITGTRAALAGGVTTVIDMPNNKPATNSVSRVEHKKKVAKGKIAVNLGFYTQLPKTPMEVIDLAKAGVFGYKIYPTSPIYPGKNDKRLIEYLKRIKQTELPFIIHPDNGYAGKLEKELFSTTKPVVESFVKAHNQLDEGKALEDLLRLNESIDCHIHCAHVTAKNTVKVLRNTEDTNVTSEVCPHHLALTFKELKKFKSEAKCLPPLRTKEDQSELWSALRDDVIQYIATDHAPHSYKEKHCEFLEAASGIPGLETLLPVMMTFSFKGMISLEELITKMTSNPAKFLALEDRGLLENKKKADIIIVKKEKNKIDQEQIESKAKWTPLNGFNSLVKLQQVIVNGVMVKDEEHIEYKARTGKILQSKLRVPKELLDDED